MSEMTQELKDVVNYIFFYCKKNRHSINNLYLNYTLYFLQCYFLKKYHYPLFVEDFEARRFGPIIFKVYHKYCIYGANPIDTYDIEPVELGMAPIQYKEIDRIILSTLNTKFYEFPRLLKDSAWDMIFSNGKGRYCEISKELIKKY